MKSNPKVTKSLLAILLFVFMACTAASPGCDCNAHGAEKNPSKVDSTNNK